MDQANLRESLRALPRAARILFFGTFLNKFGTFVVPFLTLYMIGLGYTTAQAGAAIATYGWGTLCASLLGGHLADGLGRRKTIVLSMFSAACVMVCLSQARTLPMIILLSGLAGLTAELYRPASSALLADLVPSGQRVTAFTVYRIAINAGLACGAATGGFLASHSFGWLFLGDAATSILFGLVAWFALPAGLHGVRAENPLRETLAVIRRNAAFRRVLCACLVIGIVFVQIFTTMSLEIKQSGFTPAIFGLVISLNGILIVLCELPLTMITRRYPARRVMALGFLLIGAGFASNALARTLPLLGLTTLLFTLGEMIAFPISAAYVADLAPAHQRGVYMGAYGLVWALAFVAGPPLGLLLFGTSHLAVWISCGVLGVLAAGIILAEPRPAPAAQERNDAPQTSPSQSYAVLRE
jgi:MFS family permease